MAAFRIAFILAFVACVCVGLTIATDAPTEVPSTTPSPSADRSFSIESSNAPNTQFEWDAVQCLSEAYILHPDSLDTVTETFGKLYQLKHPGVWRVNAGCKSLYVPQANVTIVVKVTEGSSKTSITLYN